MLTRYRVTGACIRSFGDDPDVIQLLAGDCRDVLPTLPAESVQCCVSSPPYYALRSYLPDGHADKHREIGSEPTPDEYLATMVAVFREVRRVLRRDGTLWLNIGDSYSGSANSGGDSVPRQRMTPGGGMNSGEAVRVAGMASNPGKPKDLLLMPARLALALQADGWWVRSDIIWHKPNPMPESCTDRPTSAHEHVFLLTRSARYYYDNEGVREESETRLQQRLTAPTAHPKAKLFGGSNFVDGGISTSRNLRNVWTIPTHAYPAAHFATYPPQLAERCIRAGTRLGDTVLDPFIGAGTTALVADRLQRDCIGIDLNVAYTEMAMQRCRDDAPLFTAFPPADDPEEARMADMFANLAAD
jgi:DNA modification methylase